MVDIHSHILPNIDDGSSSLEESKQLLAELSKQGITTVAATPHFYADRDRPDLFFQRRDHAIAKLEGEQIPDIKILPGAEVYYYPGISQTDVLPDFAIGSTRLFLLEMPFTDWTPSIVNEVMSIRRDRNLRVVIAHIDRYLSRKNLRYAEDMLENDILIQVNANAFLDRKRRNDALNLLKRGAVHFIGSDTHNMQTRAPKLSEAYAVIEQKLGRRALQWLEEISDTYF